MARKLQKNLLDLCERLDSEWRRKEESVFTHFRAALRGLNDAVNRESKHPAAKDTRANDCST